MAEGWTRHWCWPWPSWRSRSPASTTRPTPSRRWWPPGTRPGPAIILAAVCNLLGPLLLGAAVADTIAGIVEVTPAQTVIVVGAALTAAVIWNLVTWRWGCPPAPATRWSGPGGRRGGGGWHRGGQLGRRRRRASDRRGRGPGGAGDLAGAGLRRGLADGTRRASLAATGHHPCQPAGAAGAVGDLRVAGLQPRRQRCPEGGRRAGGAAAGQRDDPVALGAGVGHLDLRRRPHPGDGPWWMADRQDHRAPHLPYPPSTVWSARPARRR